LFNLVIEDDIRNVKDSNQDKNLLLEEINTRIKDLKDDYKENVNFLVGYDKQKYLNVY
jgi:archaellum component FlaC